MTRITSSELADNKPKIERNAVRKFFDQRAEKISSVGPVRAVIYQDKHPDLAERRNHSEKELLLPLLTLNGAQRVLDIGCGTGRWTGELLPRSTHYHGLDFSAGLIAHARETFPESDHCRFSVASADSYSLTSLSESDPFDRVLCFGVLIYLNDDEVLSALDCMGKVAAQEARIILREPMGTADRLTLRKHYSDEMEQEYNAIYRTQHELEDMIAMALGSLSFNITSSGDVYQHTSLNNRSETCQRWLLLERS